MRSAFLLATALLLAAESSALSCAIAGNEWMVHGNICTRYIEADKGAKLSTARSTCEGFSVNTAVVKLLSVSDVTEALKDWAITKPNTEYRIDGKAKRSNPDKYVDKDTNVITFPGSPTSASSSLPYDHTGDRDNSLTLNPSDGKIRGNTPKSDLIGFVCSTTTIESKAKGKL